MSESTSSFADSQYDMVDDLSEISSEDRDTASLGSADHIDDDIATDEEESFGCQNYDQYVAAVNGFFFKNAGV
ncbi:hypothetical protein LTR17_024265 [Elasticomyces elasticus]|nr:hypothetical protein LTR17_024265 [Elasticomyces elasticus]